MGLLNWTQATLRSGQDAEYGAGSCGADREQDRVARHGRGRSYGMDHRWVRATRIRDGKRMGSRVRTGKRAVGWCGWAVIPSGSERRGYKTIGASYAAKVVSCGLGGMDVGDGGRSATRATWVINIRAWNSHHSRVALRVNRCSRPPSRCESPARAMFPARA
jgi:hypothetical protein